jgi:drug/metabolite transporter (DMT)-like permease
MTLIAVLIFTVEIVVTVAGQLLLKHAMEGSNTVGFRNRRVLALFLAGVAGLTISFFLTIALLQHFDLSYFYPIQGSTVVLITIAAVIFLREKLSIQLLAGSLLISAGIALVSLS